MRDPRHRRQAEGAAGEPSLAGSDAAARRGRECSGGRGGAGRGRGVRESRRSRRRRRGTRRVRVQGGQPAARDLEVLLEPRDLEYVRALEQAEVALRLTEAIARGRPPPGAPPAGRRRCGSPRRRRRGPSRARPPWTTGSERPGRGGASGTART